MEILKSLKIHVVSLVLISGMLGTMVDVSFASAGMAVIVNKDNSYSASPEEAKTIVARLFLKNQSEWPGGIPGKPYDRKGISKEHASFVKEVLGMDEAKLTQHWIKSKQLSGETPPRVIKPNKILIKMVGKNKGAIGVISESEAAKLPGNVKVLFTY
ncbi:MAG: hypothetical protein NPIRA05_20980 [Nitrospirales bacterium]|nr:MAG: hypothetical protein NPIRA05_20980 [Nitrospirales bacterium]